MYQAILFHPEGDYVTDFKKDTKQEVWESIADMGSRWIFYPIPFVATDKTIVSVCEPSLQWMEGKRITTIKKYFNTRWKEDADFICEVINNGYPLSLVY